MASALVPQPAPVQQPDLRAFIVCDRLPEGCRAYPVTNDRHEPLLRAGEWVVVDPEDTTPVDGELFVIQWQHGTAGPQVVECGEMKSLSVSKGYPMWAVGVRHRGHNDDALGYGAPGQLVGDLPYRCEQLAERFLGKVVGILAPTFAAPMREIA